MVSLDFPYTETRQPPGHLGQEVGVLGGDLPGHLRGRIRQREGPISADLDALIREIRMLDGPPFDKRLGPMLVKPLQLVAFLFISLVFIVLAGSLLAFVWLKFRRSFGVLIPLFFGFLASQSATAMPGLQALAASESRPLW